MMRTVRLLVMLLLLCQRQAATAADPAPMVDLKVATQGDIWQGQRVIISVTLKTPGTFASAPAFDLPQIPSVILVPPTGRPVIGTETIDEASFTTQQHELTLLPQQSGRITIPPFVIRFDSNAGFGTPVHSHSVTTPAVSIVVKRPPGTESLSMVLTTTKLTVTETWKPEPGNDPVTVGTAFTCTIQIGADNLPGILLPSFSIKPINGLRVYDRPPTLNDQDNRGELVGQRSDTSTLLCQQPGRYELPAMNLSWWNPDEQQLHQITLPAHIINVVAPPEADESMTEPTPPPATTGIKSLLVSAVSILLLVSAVAYRMGPALKRRWIEHQQAWAESEGRYFHDVLHACAAGNAAAVYKATAAWISRIQAELNSGGQPRVDVLRCDQELAIEWQRLDQQIHGPAANADQTTWSSERLLAALKSVRRMLKQRQHRHAKFERLPDLNPH